MKSFKNNIISIGSTIEAALEQMSGLGTRNSLFVIENDGKLVGSLTDGDIRRGILRKHSEVGDLIDNVMNTEFCSINRNSFKFDELLKFRAKNVKLLPEIDSDGKLINILDFSKMKSILPIDAVIVAGGKGSRLLPLTENTPKPLLKVGDIPIIERNVDRLISYGVENIYITVNYLGDMIEDYFSSTKKDANIHIIKEKKPLGTFGSISLIQNEWTKDVLVMNSDLLTNIDFEDLYKEFIRSEGAFTVCSVPYTVSVPYAVMELNGDSVKDFVEKPNYTYYSNAGIYMCKHENLKLLNYNEYLDATDFMTNLLSSSQKVSNYPILGYWLDIGQHEDFQKANSDIHHIKF